MSTPLVSIIMGAYNCENTIYDCMESILKQTYENWEFIICDDCSSDHTLEILKKYEKNDKRIHILHNEKNMRLAASLNRCLEVAHGKYVARMDADDISMPDRLEKQVEFLQKSTLTVQYKQENERKNYVWYLAVLNFCSGFCRLF